MPQTETEWLRKGKYIQQSTDDYVITVGRQGKVIKENGESETRWRFVVYGPSTQTQSKNGHMHYQELVYRTQYQKGEEMPPSLDYETKRARRLIGGFDTLEQAKQACTDHKEKACK